jgi:Tol biopolymer transport system component
LRGAPDAGRTNRALLAAGALFLLAAAPLATHGAPELFAPGIASTRHAEIRLTISPDGRTALWFSRDRPGGVGGYDIWLSRRTGSGWSPAAPVSFNSAGHDFDPAFSDDGRFVYFCSDRPGGLGGDDLYIVPVAGGGFGEPVNLGGAVNSAGNEFAPMPAPGHRRLLFSSDRPGGAGGHDLFVAGRRSAGFAPAHRLAGEVNTPANEFDPTFLADGVTIVFARAMDFSRDRVELFHAAPVDGRYRRGTPLPPIVNNGEDAYGAMLDWSDRSRLTFSRRNGAAGMDLYRIRYRLGRRQSP